MSEITLVLLTRQVFLEQIFSVIMDENHSKVSTKPHIFTHQFMVLYHIYSFY